MIRVCYVIPSLDYGGTERQLVALAGGLGAGYEVTILCTRKEGTLAQEARQRGATVESLGLRGGWDMRLRGRLRKRFTDHRPDVLHTFLSGFDLGANRAADEVGVPAIVSSRRELAAWQKPRHLRAQRQANQYANIIVANSEAAAEFAQKREGAPPELFRVIRNGIVVDEFVSLADAVQVKVQYGVPIDTQVICTVANLSPVKDYPLFIGACNEVLKNREDVHVVIVGDGPLRDSVSRKISVSDRPQAYTRIPSTEFIGDVLNIADVFVLCSKQEGSPNAIIEAMAAGKPVVAANVGGIPELIEDGVRGRLVSERTPEAFAGAIESVLDDPGKAAAMARAAQRWVRENMSVDVMVEAYRTLYAELLSRDARRIG